jgi:uncharacterized protein
MKVVLDTNILVSALLTPHGAPGRVIDLLLNGDLTPCFDDRIMAEYREVLARPKFGFDSTYVEAFLDNLEGEGQRVIAAPIHVKLPDPDDRIFLEVAAASGAEYFITGNIRHFPVKSRLGVKVIEPDEFVKQWEGAD